MSDDKEREDLDALMKAPGWLRLKNAVEKEWVGRFDDYVTAAVSGQRDAVQELVKLTAAKSAVLAALQYPQERIRQIDAAVKERTATEVMARGGFR